ncbi:hypothetical protein C1G86_0974 [Dehalococcoides mccartyi]|uniref:Uncharacterized protein n=1 Tax=Dehalococcoides mccartyi TaxID=61435 RepID=A0A328EPG4_9CHLR|nr:hypothetical protein C1G87_0947 [Dehalococcoides mccartyi]RAL70430.1 hypothetical protein C1G86_0974 [Dehalococcoides mccartyi]
MTSETDEQVMDSGLRILARMIARLYRMDIAKAKENAIEEEPHADQGSNRGHQAT